MRLGQNAPDDHDLHNDDGEEDLASMRPGQNAPDDGVAQCRAGRLLEASMRPGQNAPDDLGIYSLGYQRDSPLQ